MLLYLLRHADAEMPAPSDDERPLSPKGIEQAKRVGKFCREMDIRLGLVLTSPLRRARQTAQYAAEPIGAEVIETPWVASGMTPHTAVEELSAYKAHEAVTLVGHEPDFSQLIAYLLGLASPTQVHVR